MQIDGGRRGDYGGMRDRRREGEGEGEGDIKIVERREERGET